MRWLVRALGAVALMVVLAVGALLALPTDRIAGLAAERLGAVLGREVTLQGSVSPTLWPYLGVRAELVQVANPAWVTQGPLITAEAMSIKVPWAAIFAGAAQIEDITLIAPQITLVRGVDGATSWDMGPQTAPAPSAAPTEPGASAAFGIAGAEITRASLTYIDMASGQSLQIDDLDASVTLPSNGPATIEAEARVNGTQLTMTARLGAPRALVDGALSPIVATLDWAGGTGRFDGQAGLAPALVGALTLEATDMDPLLAIIGAAMPELPLGYGRDRLALSGEVTLTNEGTAHLRGARLTLDDTQLGLDLDIAQGADRPIIRGAVTGTRLTLPASGSAAQTGPGWSRAPIDVSGLFAADAEIALAITEVAGAGVTLGPVDLRATLDQGRLVLDIERIGVYGGVLAGDFVVNGRGGLSVRSDLLLADVDLNPLLRDLAGYDRLDGTGSASLQVLGVGNDMASIMASLSGAGDFAFGAGAIRGLDLAGMIRNFDASFRGEGARTVYDRVGANFTISNGILANDDLILEAPWGEVTGAGTVDIGAQTLAYRVIPGVMRGQAGAALRVPVLITGSWANPTIRPDLEFLAEQELAEERARLEAEARARLDAEATRLEDEARRRANEALGTQFDSTTTTQDARDALEQRLRDEAEQQLLRLLGRN